MLLVVVDLVQLAISDKRYAFVNRNYRLMYIILNSRVDVYNTYREQREFQLYVPVKLNKRTNE